MRGEHIIMRGVVNSSHILQPLPDGYAGRKVRSVWLLLNEADFTAAQEAIHHRNAFLDDQMHDWNQKGDALRYHAHSSARGDVVDIIIFFEESPC
ncbi:hypothetical protein BLA6863_00226 [Burkholderia lata]|uniref:Uncharacterized protein n=1 Tax=Burkholderia lata (strain ATCC 17760 / DSM 23089 / LMG 22485 / NCIMB 9086 / R18194 / 383) TaxID=482957 RepID=A0A6P2GVJ6_BURL3|nr:hypothetical protein BLA6863_00226 [Burkholderia lata]